MRYIKFILVSLCILCLVGCSNKDNAKINTESIADSNTESASTSVVEESDDFEILARQSIHNELYEMDILLKIFDFLDFYIFYPQY